MSIFRNKNYCLSCMAPVSSEKEKCKKCGFTIEDYPKSPRSLKPGTVINERYLTGIVISENPYSITYVGMDLGEKKKKIIKEYFPFSCCSRNGNEFEENSIKITEGKNELFDAGLNDFVSQAKKLKKIAADNSLEGIFRVTNVIEAAGTAYVISDYVNGTNLKRVLKNDEKKITADELFKVMKPIVKSLITLHGEGIYHGAISPVNVLISDDRKSACLVDFGIYGIGDNAFKFALAPKGGFTPVEEYTAFRGEIGGWTDIFGLCSTIYYGITGTVPPDAPDRSYSDHLKAPSELGVSISEDKESALLQGLEVYPKDRFKAVRALYNAMYSEEASEEEAPSVKETKTPEKEEKKPVPASPSSPAVTADVKPTPQAKKGKPTMINEDIAPWAEIETQGEKEKKKEEPSKTSAPVQAMFPAPKSKYPAAANKAPYSPDSYSQVIISRKSKDNIEIGGIKLNKKAEKLDLTSKGITDDDSDSIGELTGLEYLTIDDNKIGDIEFVSSLKKLILFSAAKNYITDISPLINLGQLNELNLSGNRELEDISVLEYLRGIRKLDLSDTAIKSVAPLIYLDHLKSLNLKGTQITERQIKALYAEMPTCSIRYDVKKK